MEETTVRTMVADYFRERRFDGLFSTWQGCCCSVTDLAACEKIEAGCEAGYRVPADAFPAVSWYPWVPSPTNEYEGYVIGPKPDDKG